MTKNNNPQNPQIMATEWGFQVDSAKFHGGAKKLMRSAQNYLTEATQIKLNVTLLNPSDPEVKQIPDEITAVVVNCLHGAMKGLVTLHCKVSQGTQSIQSVETDGNTKFKLIREGDDIVVNLDTHFNAGAIIQISRATRDGGELLRLDDLSGLYARLERTGFLPDSEGEIVDYDDLDEEGNKKEDEDKQDDQDDDR